MSPPPTLTTPSPRQLRWHQLEQYGFLHFTLNTFTDREWGYGDESPVDFNPSHLDCDQWVTAAKAGGLKGLIFTAKHHDGFCLWPTRTTEHNISHSPFRDGKGDLARELSDACKEGGIGFGIYCSPWDRNHPEYGRDAYVEVYHEQWRELLTDYGPLFEVWLDGANGGDGYYGGARETRSIDPATYYRNHELLEMFRELQPDAVVAGGPNADLRWCGNEHGFTSFTNWATVSVNESLTQGARDQASVQGTPEGNTWRPTEVDVSIRRGWFWHPEERPHEPETLFKIWLSSVGRGAGLLLNLAPNRKGLIPPEDVRTLMRYKQMVDEFCAVDLGPGCTLQVEAQPDPSPLVDGNPDTVWKTTSEEVEIVFEFGEDLPVTGLRIAEEIQWGQRILSWSLDIQTWGAWFEAARGTTIGAQRLIRLEAASGSALRFRVERALAPAVLKQIQIFCGTDRMH